MDFLSLQLEATSDVDIPPQSWAKVTSAADKLVGLLWGTGKVSLRVVTATAIRGLNKQFRGHDAATDVLSFPAHGGDNLGEIALNWAAVCIQAEANANTPDSEAVALVTHALLHLAGYTHGTDPAEAEMTIKTISLCKQAGYEVETFGH